MPRSFMLGSCVLVTLSAVLGGCDTTPSNKAIVGSWEGRATDADRPFSFGSVTFAPEGRSSGTYTAEAKYGDKTRVQTGWFAMTAEGGLVLDGERTYDLRFEDGAVIFVDPTTGNAMTLDRFE